MRSHINTAFVIVLLALKTNILNAQTVSPVASQTVCNGAAIAPVNFSGSGTVYSWTNSATSIGLAATGSGDITSFSVTNPGSSPVTASITVQAGAMVPTVITQTYNYTGSIQSYTVPTGVTTISITAKGAQGGNVTSDGAASGGNGAVITAKYTVTAGHILSILVGQQPTSAANTAGGGGGSFVWNTSASNALLVAAGGGGGAASTAFGCNCSRNGANAGLILNGSSGTGGLGGAGSGGNGGTVVLGAQSGAYGGGGAGWISNGIAATTNGNCPQAGSAALTPLNGGTGGNSAGGPWGATVNGNGGYGGGGGGMGFCGGQGGGGGGGGYSGGGGGNYVGTPQASHGGGGGGSYTSGTGASAIVTNTGSGQVIVSYTTTVLAYGSPANFNIVVNPTPSVNTVSSQTLCANMLTSGINFSGPVAGTEYYWSSDNTTIGIAANGTGSISAFNALNTSSLNSIATILYSPSYTVGGANCMGASKQFSITVKPLPMVSASSATVCSGNAPAISISSLPSAGSFSWTVSTSGAVAGASSASGASITQTLTGSGSAVYSITGQLNGCQGPAKQVTVTVNGLPSVSSNVSASVVCQGNTVVANGTGASTYTWTGGITNNVSFTPGGTTTYTVSGTDLNGCQNTAVRTISVNALPVIAVNSGSVCAGQIFTMAPTGASTYTFSSTTPTVVNTTAGTYSYSVIGTGTNGCVSFPLVIASVTVSARPVITVNSGSICAGETFTMLPGGASTYTFSNGSNVVSPSPGIVSYSVSGTGVNGCVSDIPAVADVTVEALPVLSITSGTLCEGETFTLTPSGASTYTYSGGSNIVSPMAGTTSYSITGMSAAGCEAFSPAIATMTVYGLPTLAVSGGSICSGQIFTISPAGAASYSVWGINGFTVDPQSTIQYSVTGTSTEGCISDITVVTVTVHATPSVAVNSSSLCMGQSFVISPSGADSYSITGNTFTVSPTANTSYTVTGSSLAGCTSGNLAIAALTVYSTPSISVSGGSVCAGGSLTITAAGAVNYAITGNSFTVSPLLTTSYSVTGSSAEGCVSDVVTATVTVLALPVLTVTSSSSLVCIGEEVILTASGADAYIWNGQQAGSAIAFILLDTTTYSVTGTDANGCVSTATVQQLADACTGVAEWGASGFNLSVYPNPNTGEFAIDAPEGTRITIVNALGQVVLSDTATTGTEKYSLHTAPNGIYMVTLEHGGKRQVIKMIRE